MRLRALIWDVDGTLAETEDEGHRVAFERAFDEVGLPWRWDAATYGELLAVTGGKERLLAWWRRVDPVAAAAAGADTFVRRLHALKTSHYLALLDQGAVALRPGVRRLLDEARRQGLRQAIATTTTPENVTRLIDRTLGEDASAWFEVVGAGDVVAAKKPAPDIFRWVLQRLGLAAAECLVIEDSAAGAAAARAAGLPVVVTRSRYTAADAVGEVAADLDGLGEAGRPARGIAQGRPWSGVVDVAQLRRWQGGDQKL